MKTVILLSGKRLSGKDTVAKLLKSEKIVCVAFADELKREYARLSGASYERIMMDGKYKEEHRRALIELATSTRFIEPTRWARLVYEKHVNDEIIVVSDWRFPDEAEYFEKKCRVIRVRINASESIRKARGWVYNFSVDEDQSERVLDTATFDITVNNDGDLDALRAQLVVVVGEATDCQNENPYTFQFEEDHFYKIFKGMSGFTYSK